MVVVVVKVKVTLEQATKAQRCSGCIAINLGANRPGTHCIGGGKSRPPTGIRFPGRPARSEVLIVVVVRINFGNSLERCHRIGGLTYGSDVQVLVFHSKWAFCAAVTGLRGLEGSRRLRLPDF